MQRFLYILLYPILWCISVLPFWLLYAKSTALYIITYYLIGYRKKTVKNNLKLAFPEKSVQERNAIAKAFYKHLCDLIFETIKSLTISEKTIERRVSFTNLALLHSYYKENKSVLLMCGHYGNWEWNGILNRKVDFNCFAVYKKLDNPYFDTLVRKTRERFGGTIVTNKRIVPLLFREAKEGRPSVTLILSDQTPKRNAYKYRDTFMGIDVPMFTGTEELANRLGFATVYLKVEKVKRGYYDITFIPLSEGKKPTENFEITRIFFDEIEKQIREEPAYYLWSHKRWKHRKV
ncbi:lysophospholipid acyltransferase family protein [Flavobacteriaceae bacterium TK19130]|nr:lysophospholipid acyltransferase family protein [Thermobacterium salinum]